MERARAILVFGQITAGSAVGRSGYVDVEPEVQRILTRRATGGKVGLAAMDGVVAVVLQELGQRGDGGAVFQVALRGLAGRLDAVVVPVGQGYDGAGRVGLGVVLQRPVGHAVAGGIHARHQAAA